MYSCKPYISESVNFEQLTRNVDTPVADAQSA